MRKRNAIPVSLLRIESNNSKNNTKHFLVDMFFCMEKRSAIIPKRKKSGLVVCEIYETDSTWIG